MIVIAWLNDFIPAVAHQGIQDLPLWKVINNSYCQDDVMLMQVNMVEKNNTYYGLRLVEEREGGFLQLKVFASRGR